jgi:hypothetical protein
MAAGVKYFNLHAKEQETCKGFAFTTLVLVNSKLFNTHSRRSPLSLFYPNFFHHRIEQALEHMAEDDRQANCIRRTMLMFYRV